MGVHYTGTIILSLICLLSLYCLSLCLKMRMSEMEISRAQNLIDHEKEIFSRPARTWITKETNGQPTPPLPLPLSG